MSTRLIFAILTFISTVTFASEQHVATGGSTTCASSSNGFQCWGADQLQLPQLKDIVQISQFGEHKCITTEGQGSFCLTRDGHQWAFPNDATGIQIENGTGNHICVLNHVGVHCTFPDDMTGCDLPDFKSPTQISVKKALDNWTVNGGASNLCVVDSGELKCYRLVWGLDQLCEEVPVPGRNVKASAVAVGVGFICALSPDKKVSCWGSNDYGQLNVPQNLSNVVKLSAGENHVCAVDINGLVHCWGDNSFAQADVPKDLAVASEVSAGYRHTCAVTKSGIRCWGDNSAGQCNVPKSYRFR